MSFEVIINLVLSILSFALAALSIVFVALTLKQNNRMLYANARPYLSVYFAYEENSPIIYLCIKNSGSASAIINELKISPDLQVMEKSISSIVKDALIAPNQQLHFLMPKKDEIQKGNEYVIEICYVDVNELNKSIKEKYKVNIGYINYVLHSESTKSGLTPLENGVRNIEKSMRSIMLKNL